jgi:hypothetical protein
LSRRRNQDHRPRSLAARPADSAGVCPDCGKRRYASKRAARTFARTVYPGSRMRVYPCGDFWHVTSQDADQTTAWRDWVRGPDLNSGGRKRKRR